MIIYLCELNPIMSFFVRFVRMFAQWIDDEFLEISIQSTTYGRS